MSREILDQTHVLNQHPQVLHGCLQQFLGGGFDVAGEFGAGETPELTFAGSLDAGTDGGGVLDLAFAGEFFVVDPRNFDVDVDADTVPTGNPACRCLHHRGETHPTPTRAAPTG